MTVYLTTIYSLTYDISIYILQEVQERVKTHLLGTDLAYFKYDDFIYVLDLVNR